MAKSAKSQTNCSFERMATSTNVVRKCFVKWLFKAAFLSFAQKAIHKYVDEIDGGRDKNWHDFTTKFFY
jgi:hypothetical protein